MLVVIEYGQGRKKWGRIREGVEEKGKYHMRSSRGR